MEESKGPEPQDLSTERDSIAEVERDTVPASPIAPLTRSAGIGGETNFWYLHGEFRVFWKVSAYGTVAFFAMIFGGIAFFGIFREADWRFATPIITLSAALAATLFCAWAIERIPLRETGPILDFIGLRPHPRALRQLLLGLGITLLLQGILLVLELLFGGARMLSGHVTIAHTLSLLLYGFASFILVGFAEEILVRGYAFRVLQKQGSAALALLLTSGLFSLMHALNPGIGWIGFANIFLAGIWLGVARIVTGSLWLSVGMHIGWNFFLGPVFGFPVSGIIERSVFVTTPRGAEWISGGAFGPEGGILVTLLLLAATAALHHPRVRALVAPLPDETMLQETIEVRE
ncbi:MAG: CPBP family intramembrane metalloprotease [Bacteroidetes bacterium]|nr:CPBP family intramembrane metalloprotease [Bacteroidota bacterium]